MCFTALGFCSYEITDGGTRGMFQWNETEVNTTASISCRYGPAEAMATRQCVSGLTWAAPSIDQCRTVVSEQFSNIQQVTIIMLLVVCNCFYQLQVNVSIENVNGVISNLTNIVTTANETSDQNSDSLEVVANLLTQSVDVIMTQNASLAVINQVS